MMKKYEYLNYLRMDPDEIIVDYAAVRTQQKERYIIDLHMIE
jgi:hypothetical protein